MVSDKTNAMRALDSRGIDYDVLTFSPSIHSADGIAEALGIPLAQVYKTLVVLGTRERVMLFIVPGDRSLDTKRAARAAGEKKVRMAPHKVAEAVTGLQVGGISALALLDRPFDVFLDSSAAQLDRILVSAGKRGVNLRLAVDDLLRVTGARLAEVAAPKSSR